MLGSEKINSQSLTKSEIDVVLLLLLYYFVEKKILYTCALDDFVPLNNASDNRTFFRFSVSPKKNLIVHHTLMALLLSLMINDTLRSSIKITTSGDY